MLIVATVLFGILFFLTIFMQVVLGYSALRSGLAFGSAMKTLAFRVRGEDLAGGGTPVPQQPVSGAALAGASAEMDEARSTTIGARQAVCD